jgi:hypothetical protein
MLRKPVLAVVALGAGAIAFWLGRTHVSSDALGRLARRAAPGLGEPSQQPGREPWQCACGQRYFVAGRDRHRIYWLEKAPESEPLLSETCPTCDRALPAEHEVATAQTH